MDENIKIKQIKSFLNLAIRLEAKPTIELNEAQYLLDYINEINKRNASLQYALCAVREKWNNDKARYRRKAKKYRFILKESNKFIEEEKNRLARECSQIYEDSLGKTHLVSEDIYNELIKISNKIQELKEKE